MFVRAQFDVALRLHHQRRELLLLVGDARRKRSDMPVDVGVPLVASQAHDVETLGRHSGRYSAANTVDEAEVGDPDHVLDGEVS